MAGLLLCLLLGLVLLAVGVMGELARGMATAPSLHRPWGAWVAIAGLGILLVAGAFAVHRLFQILRPWIG